MSPWPQRGLLETKKTNRSLPLAELFYWEEEEGWENPSHRTAVVSGDGDTLTAFP